MWPLCKRFAMGSLLGGVLASLATIFILGDRTYALWQLCWGYSASSCLAGLLFSGTARLLGQPRGNPSKANLRFAWIAGTIATLLQFMGSIMTGSFEVERAFLFGVPPLAALLFVWKMRRQGSQTESDSPAAVQDQAST